MKKFKYRLQKVLDVKEMVLKKTQRDLHMAQTEQEQADTRLHEMKSSLEDYRRNLDGSRRETAGGLRMQYGYFYQLLDDVDLQQQEVAKKAANVHTIRERLTDEQRGRKILAKLKEKSFEDYSRQVNKDEQIFLDEISLSPMRRK
ncbi:MAG: flagellar export protein FliJ [Calditrichia bacterium]